jgi:hypothetical protein
MSSVYKDPTKSPKKYISHLDKQEQHFIDMPKFLMIIQMKR